MLLHILFLLQSFKSSSDSSSQSFEKITPDSLLSWSNPLILALIFMVFVLAVGYIFYRYAIIPLKKKHLEEEENLKLQHAELMSLFAELSPDPILRFDRNGKIILSNHAAHDVFKGKRIQSISITDLFTELKQLSVARFIQENGMDKFISDVEDKTFQWIINGIAANDIGQIYGRDITELIKKDLEIRSALDEAKRANSLKDDFLMRISHEIRSPLASVQGLSRLLYDSIEGDVDDKLRRMLLLIENSGKELIRTVDLLVNMSMVYTGTYSVKKQNFNLYEKLHVLFREYKSIADEKQLEFNLLPESESEFIINADEYSVVKIFDNLINNAFKYTKAGEIKISVQQDEQFILGIIEDTGLGISGEYQKKLFTPFSQEDMGYTRKFDGIGLGLTLVKKFIDYNEAEIVFESKERVGTKVIVKFRKENPGS